MRDLEKLGYSSEARQMLEEERKRLKEKLEKTEEYVNKINTKDNGEELKEIKVGEEVFIPTLNMKAIVLSRPDAKGEIQVQAGIMKINVNAKELRASRGVSSQKNILKRKVNLNMNSVSTTVDIRGLDAEEAIYTVDKYLDDAYVAGLKEVTIIHGKGTGILRQTIGEMLKKHTHVKSCRLGEYGEGGSGVTIAELK